MSDSARRDLFVFPSIEQSFLIIIMLAIKADNIFSTSEKKVIKSSLLTLELFQNYSEEELKEGIKKALLRIEIRGAKTALLEAANNLPKELHQSVFTLAAELIVSDSKITKTEQEILDRLQKVLSIPKDVAQQIILEKIFHA